VRGEADGAHLAGRAVAGAEEGIGHRLIVRVPIRETGSEMERTCEVDEGAEVASGSGDAEFRNGTERRSVPDWGRRSFEAEVVRDDGVAWCGQLWPLTCTSMGQS
jgi:hypothetical protein